MLVPVVPVFAQDDILLPAADAPDTPDLTPDPSALTAPVDPSEAAAAEEAMDDLLKKIDEGAAKVEEPPPTVPEIEPEVVDGNPVVTPPTDATLASPETPAAASALAEVAKDPADATNVTEIPALPANDMADENLFFDANTLVPTGEMGSGTPRKVNPALQPASKLIVVTKDYEPSSRQAQLVSAERAMLLGRYDAALEMYNVMYAKNKRDPHIIMGRAVALQHMGNVDEAITAYQEVLDVRPDNAQAQINMLGLMGERYPAVSLQRLLELRDKDPDNVAIVGQIAVMQANMGQYDEAFKYLGMAASMEPHNANHLFNMAVIADRAGNKDEAIKYYEDALETDSIYGGGTSIPRDSVFERLARLR